MKNINNEKISLITTIEWIEITKQLPPKFTYVWLANINENMTGHSFVHEFDLTTQHFEKMWTHWALAKLPGSK
jgi:hypothetical protein